MSKNLQKELQGNLQKPRCEYCYLLSEGYIICDLAHRAIDKNECPKNENECVYIGGIKNAESKSMQGL